MMLLLSLCLSYAGFCCLAMSLNRHRRQCPPPALLSSSLRLRTLGWLLLGLSLLPCLPPWPTGIAIAAWVGSLSLSATAVVLMFSYYPERAVRIIPPLLSVSVLLSLIKVSV